METERATRLVFLRSRFAPVAVFLAMLVLAACADTPPSTQRRGGNAQAVSPAEGFNSPYCVTARKWAVHELTGGGDTAYARGGPPALRKWWQEQLAYLKVSLQQAPPVIREAEALNERVIRTQLTPVVEKYGFDARRLEAEGTAAEKALVMEPPPEVAAAQEARNLYQNRVCGYGGSPPPADVTFKATPAAKLYCEAVAAERSGEEEVRASGFDPEAFRSFATSEKLADVLDAQDANAPPEIAADVRAVNQWTRDRWLEVAQKFDYDYRRILLEGSEEDLKAFTFWDPAIAEQDSRVTAYQEQVCGG